MYVCVCCDCHSLPNIKHPVPYLCVCMCVCVCVCVYDNTTR